MVEDRDDLSNAIAINSSMANGARLIGPAIAGLVIGAVGEGWCFLIDGASYFAVIASLLLMRIHERQQPRRVIPASMPEQIREGWNYVSTFRPIRTILLLFALISLMGYSYSVLLPVFAAQVLHGGASTLGWLTTASGIGALTSALSLAVRKSVVGLERMLQVASAMLGSALILFGLSHTMWLSFALMVFVGFGLMQCASASNTIIQSLVTEDKRAHHGLFWRSAVRQSSGRRIGPPDWSSPHCFHHRRVLSGWLVLLYARFAEGQRHYEADVPGNGSVACA
jgi:predicted MFS family arabinose efflux permease